MSAIPAAYGRGRSLRHSATDQAGWVQPVDALPAERRLGRDPAGPDRPCDFKDGSAFGKRTNPPRNNPSIGRHAVMAVAEQVMRFIWRQSEERHGITQPITRETLAAQLIVLEGNSEG